MSDSDIPQWKKDLIARLRSQNKRTASAQQQLFDHPPQQQHPRSLQSSASSTSSSVQQPVALGRTASSDEQKCECATTSANMVQELRWGDEKNDSDEDLHYGPGIVSKLKERYLSLAQREKVTRPSILRKAASLENLLDDAPEEPNRLFQASQNKNVPSRYAKKDGTLKRARSVETISSTEQREGKEQKRESLHEEMLITNTGSLIIPEKTVTNEDNNKYARINRPKRIAPVMNEREKPPADVVKQAKMIFERRPEQRTKPPQQTGEVAAKVATYKSIIVQNKPAKKPAIKTKPVIGDKPITNGIKLKSKPSNINSRPYSPDKKSASDALLRPKSPEKRAAGVDVAPERNSNGPLHKKAVDSPLSPTKKFVDDDSASSKSTTSLPSPIPDISRIDFIKGEENGIKATNFLSETPDLIITSSPLPVVNSPSFRISATENFIKEEIRLAQNEQSPLHEDSSESSKKAPPSPTNSMRFNFAKSNNAAATNKIHNHLPVNKNVLNTQTPPSQPLKLEINGIHEPSPKKQQPKETTSTTTTPSNSVLLSAKPTLTSLEIEKNLINTAKTLEKPNKANNSNSVITKLNSSANEVTTSKVPKVRKTAPRELENNSIVFNFSDRKDVPDYVHNDGVKRVAKLEKPKVGEGGIILLPGASVGESFTDEDEEELLRSLEAPPSPCDVAFINDNILIDGKSSLSQKTKKAKLKISFVDEGPEIYEYPSETSLLIDDTPTSPPIAHSVPSLTGSSSLGNYTPKGTEAFQPGVTRSIQNMPLNNKSEILESSDLVLQEVEKPILFSAGANSDILF